MKGRAVSGQGVRLSEPLTTTLLFRAVECRPFEDPLRNFPFPRKGEQEEGQSQGRSGGKLEDWLLILVPNRKRRPCKPQLLADELKSLVELSIYPSLSHALLGLFP